MKRTVNPATLSPQQLTDALAALGWKQTDFARCTGVTPAAVSAWATGKAPAPLWATAYLGAMLDLAALHHKYLAPLPAHDEAPSRARQAAARALFTYPARFKAAKEGGYVITFRDVPEALTQADSREEARAMAADALGAAIGMYLDDGRALPVPSAPKEGEELIQLPRAVASLVAAQRQ